MKEIPMLTDLLHCDWFLRRLCQLLYSFVVVSKIILAANENDRETLTEMKDFGDPLWFHLSARASLPDLDCCVFYLFLDVVKRVGRIDGEADEDDMRIRIRQRAETIVVFLTRGIPQG